MRRTVMICLAMLFAGTTISNAAGFALFEHSARVSGMVGAYAADGRDVSTIFFNPAGLAQLKGFNISVGGVFIAPRSQFRGVLPHSLKKTKMEPSQFILPHIYASYQLFDGLTAGVGLYAPFGLGSKWDRDWVGSGIATQTGIQTAVVNPVISYKLPFETFGEIYLGAGYQYGILGTALLERSPKDLGEHSSGEPRVVKLEGEIKSAFTGYNFGVIYRPMDMISVGFTYRSELELDMKGDATFTNLPESAFPTGTSGDLTITTPASWTAGISLRPMENLTINMDYVWWGWSSYDTLKVDFNTHTALLNDIVSVRSYEDVYQIRVGLEYAVSDKLTLRGGGAFDKNPIPDATIDPSLPDTDRLLGSAGLSYKVADFMRLDMYYTFIRGEERKVNPEDNTIGFAGYYNTKAHIAGAGLTLSF